MPNDDQGQSQETPAIKYVTADEIGNIVNSALTARLPRMLAPALEAALKPLTDKLNAAPPASPPPADDEDGKKKGKQSPELLAMAQQLEELKKGIVDRDAKVEAAEKKAREERSYNELRGSLEGKVRPELLDMVAKHLFVVEGRVETDETGTPLFKSTKVPYTGADPEDVRLPLRAGVEDFLKSDAAKHFLPAPTAGAGSSPLPKRGPTPTQGGTDFSKPATSDVDKARRSIERERIATERLKNR